MDSRVDLGMSVGMKIGKTMLKSQGSAERALRILITDLGCKRNVNVATM